MVIELKKGYSIDSWYDKFTDSYITRLLDPEGNQVRDALYSGDIVGRNYDIQSIRDFFKTYMKDSNFNTEPVEDFEEEDSIDEQPVEVEEEEESIEEALDPELEKKARKTKRATKKSKLPALSKMSPIMPDYRAGIDKFNAATADGNSGMASTTGSTGLGEAWMTRPELIGKLKGLGFNYKFDKYSDKALYRIYQERLRKVEKQKAEKKAEQQRADLQDQKRENAKDSYFKDDIEFESEDAAREYFGESMSVDKYSIKDIDYVLDFVYKANPGDKLIIKQKSRHNASGTQTYERKDKYTWLQGGFDIGNNELYKWLNNSLIPSAEIIIEKNSEINESMETNYKSIEDVIKRFLLSNGIKVSNIEQSYNEDEDYDIVKVWTDTMDQEKATSLVSDILYENGAKIYDEYSDLDEVKDEYISIVLCDLDYMKNKMETMKMNDKFYLNDMHEAWDIVEDDNKEFLNESIDKKDHGFKTLTEGFKYFERKYFNENYADAELQIMYESMRDKLSSEDIKKLGAFMNRAEEPDEVITYMKGLLSEDLTEEFEEDDIDRNALSMISYPLNNAIMRAADNAGCWVEENGINVYPSDNAVELVYWVDGDWKHDHIRFNNIVSNVVEEMGYELIGSSEEDADSEEPDGYGANHIYQIRVDSARTPKSFSESTEDSVETNESLNEAWIEQAWSEMTPEDEENLKYFNISWEKVGREGQDIVYRFTGSREDIEKAIGEGGYFYDPNLVIHEDGTEYVRDIDAAVKELLDRMSDVGFVVDENSSGITDNWSGGKHIQIINPDLYFPTSETEGEEISEEEAYRLFKDDVKDIVGIIDMFEDEVRDMFYITFNFGANESGQITAGLDIRPTKSNAKSTPKNESLDLYTDDDEIVDYETTIGTFEIDQDGCVKVIGVSDENYPEVEAYMKKRYKAPVYREGEKSPVE